MQCVPCSRYPCRLGAHLGEELAWAQASHQASVVVVGSGYGWVNVTRALDDHAQVTLGGTH